MHVARTHRPTIVFILIFSAVGVLVIALGVTLRSRGSHPAAGCGGVTVKDPMGGRWRCTFDDEFDGDRLDSSHWTPTTTDQYGFHGGPECFVSDPAHIGVAGGVLRLTATRSATACPVTGGFYRSGMVTSYGHFAQAYGRFAVRAKLPDRAGVQPALWLYPEQTNYGPWPASGEIDIAEVYGSPPGPTDIVRPHLHYLGPAGTGVAVGTGCHVSAVSTRYHVYAVDWTPMAITFSYDGRRCQTVDRWTPAQPLSQPAPFNAPFFVLLTLALGSPAGASAPNATTRLPVSMTVDWVRVWGD